ncbi:GTP cyclohydrolase I [Candidatus Rickettsiella isopodorum]|uniref:GTP cyclohydrolase 1 n=1 Tax=Candidatus Rickettsiella isopodorum TaxID=1225476 RepID=A0A1J8NK15_9COXI|nr:GTP cyclohydrolase I FolE [Candidatus Rickettsiella isopodorum]MCH9636416.1 GTP cyclohydrolase I FolE [Gammaproteobacteria bacterium]MDQ5899778.1 cyclohydrolase 1 [Pseudomonadota bacterium]MCH9754728.1 GTP cyclohydrolase I FolE [Gammaproteobacteria bacterium]MDD4892667.1 GTP cyclohydrolase I FolE [Candidatus Rickettsiella isopodorum]MDD5161880.1 GTP cyclohydrolase I FolE [Candidatus Rickettsiella isopodorum]
MEKHIKAILTALGEDTEREGLKNTPLRVSKSLRYLTSGSRESLDDILNGAVFRSTMEEMILVKDIELYSLCEHHLLPFIGACHIAYIPNGKIIGLSKISRIINFYARRLQIQENLTRQIADTLMKVLDAKGVAIIIEAKHLCMMMRGVEKQKASMKTSVMLGLFRQDLRTRSEFLSLIG